MVGRKPVFDGAMLPLMKPMRIAFTGRLLLQVVLDMLQLPVASVAEPAASAPPRLTMARGMGSPVIELTTVPLTAQSVAGAGGGGPG